jgi:hypothetical protein
MHACSLATGWLAAAALAAGPVAAQPSGTVTAPTTWRSAFDGYQPYAEAPLASWRESNDTVGRIGGWRAYAREAQEDARAAPQGPPAQAAPGLPAPAPASGRPATPAPVHRH